MPAGMKVIRVAVRDPATKRRVARRVEARDEAGRTVATGTSKDERFDLNDHLELVVPMGATICFAVDGVRVGQPTVVRDGSEAREITLEAPAAAR